MKLTDEQKKKIEEEYNNFVEIQYCGKTKAERQTMSQYYTPPELTIRMLEKFDDLNDSIIDPTAGAGGLIAAAIIAGADPKQCFAIELDKKIYEGVLVPRLTKLGVPKENIRRGDALDPAAWDFSKSYKYFDKEEVAQKKGRLGWFGNI